MRFLSSFVSSIYKQRRLRLMELLSSHGNSIAIIPSSTTQYSAPDVPYLFRQNMDLYYLTGHTKPDSILILSHVNDKFGDYLFVPPYSKGRARWEGESLSLKATADLYELTDTFDVGKIKEFLSQYKDTHIFIDDMDAQLKWPNVCHNLELSGTLPLYPFLQSMRLRKDPEEVEKIRQACQIMGDSLKHVMKLTQRKNMSEYLIMSEIRHQCVLRGAHGMTFPSVVACGLNSTIIHYMDYIGVSKPGDLILTDTGCHVGYYSSDLTRVWPSSGFFSEAQRDVYECVLEANLACIESFRRHNSLNFVNNLMYEVLAENLVKRGVVTAGIGNVTKVVRSELCPHHVSHYLGLDVHDTDSISRGVPLKPGIVITVEPGLYLDRTSRFVNEKYRGVGIRIEDDLLITDDGLEVLTSNCPKEIRDIEEFLKDY